MLGLLSAAVLQKPVLLPPRAMPLGTALKELETATGERYEAAAPFKSRIVLVVGPARPIEELRADLAKATWGRWRRNGDVWALEEDKEALREREKAALANRLKAIQEAQAALRKAPAAAFDVAQAKALKIGLQRYDRLTGPIEVRYPQWEKLRSGIPAVAALRRIAVTLDPAELAAIREDHPVYSDRPTRLQRPLPKAATAAIRTFERDQNVWASVNVGSEPWPARGQVGYGDDPRWNDSPVAAGGVRVLLWAAASGGSDLDLVAQFFTPQGKLVGRANLTMATGEWNADGAEPVPDPKETPMTFSEESLDHARAVAGRPSEAMREILRHPDRREPLDFYVGDALRGLAAARGKPLVAWVADTLLWPEEIAAKVDEVERPRPSEWVKSMWSLRTSTIDEGSRLIVRSRPAHQNADRSAVATLVRAAEAVGRPPLDDLADFAARHPGDRMSKLAEASLDALLPGASRLSGQVGDWGKVVLWGALSRAQRASLLKGAMIPWAILTPGQRETITRAILRGGPFEREGDFPGRVDNVLETESTEVLANEIAIAGLQGIATFQDGLLVREGRTTVAADLSTLALNVLRRERNPQSELPDEWPATIPQEFIPGRVVDFGFKVRLTRGLTWTSQGRYGEFDLRTRPLPVSSLPASLRSRYEKTLEDLRKDPPPGG